MRARISRLIQDYRYIGAYIGLALIIMLPLLKPGYIFTLDMVFGPTIKLPEEMIASYPFYALLRILNFVLPAMVIQKLLLLAIIVLAGTGAHRLVNYLLKDTDFPHSSWGAYFAGLLYIVNPFTYVRFMDGHFAVLLGYAILPFFVRCLFEIVFDKKHSLRMSFRLALYMLVIVIVSIHAAGYILVLLVSALMVQLLRGHRRLLGSLKYVGLAGVIAATLSLYWIVPTLRADTPREQLVSSFDERYYLSFRTAGKNDAAVLGNVTSLHGYWGDREGRYTLPRTVMPLWPLVFAGIFALAGYGFYVTRKSTKTEVLVLSAFIGLVLAVGVAAQPFSGLNRFLLDHVTFFRGFREPQKFVSLLTLLYATLGGVGLSYLQRTKKFLAIKSDYRPWVVAGILALPFLYTPTFVWGFAGQLRSRSYPPDWSQVNEQIVKPAHGSVLFLPWHEYMYFDFADRVVANPAPRFFDGNIIAGDNAEIGLIERQQASTGSRKIEALLANPRDNFAWRLKDMGITYVILAKTSDWQAYNFLDQPGLLKIRDTDTLIVYRVEAS